MAKETEKKPSARGRKASVRTELIRTLKRMTLEDFRNAQERESAATFMTMLMAGSTAKKTKKARRTAEPGAEEGSSSGI